MNVQSIEGQVNGKDVMYLEDIEESSNRNRKVISVNLLLQD